VDRAVAIASPLSGYEEKRWIRRYYRCQGAVTEQIVRIATRQEPSAIVLDWHGTLLPGRAELIKRLLRTTDHALILVKPHERPRMSLKLA
jgi:hypothetical protein